MNNSFKISFSDCQTSLSLSEDQITSTFSEFIDLLVHPAVISVIHHYLESQVQCADYSYLVVQLSRYFGLSEKLLLAILQQTLNVSNPNVLFRNDDLNIAILKEYTTQSASGLRELLAPGLAALRERRLSSKHLNQTTVKILQILNDYTIPLELHWFYSLLRRTVANKFPGMEIIGISGLFFLRFFYPLVLNFFSQDTLVNPDIYRENSARLIKSIQSQVIDEKWLSKKGRQSKKTFLHRLGDDDCDTSYYPLPATVPAASIVHRFFQMINQEASPLSHSLDSLGSLVPLHLKIKWSQFFYASAQITELLSQQTPRSMYKSIYGVDSPFPFDELSILNTPSSSSVSQTDPLSVDFTLSCEFPILPDLFLLSVPDCVRPDLPNLFPSEGQVSIWDSPMVLKWLGINGLESIIPSFEEQGITGYDLLRGSFRTPRLPETIKEQFKHVYNQLRRNSLNVFDDSQFGTPEEQIKALQAVIYKMAMLLNSKTH